MSQKPILLFPGQSSRTTSMLSDMLASSPGLTSPVLADARHRVGTIVDTLLDDGRNKPFASSTEVQIGVFLANHLRLVMLDDAGIEADLSLGLSLGEYNHLVHIGALSFEDTLELVAKRGQVYDDGPSGVMAAVFPLDVAELEELVAQAARHGVLEIVNFNSPSQHVVAGEEDAVNALIELVESETYATARVIEQRIPMHSSRFAPVAKALRPALDAAPWQAPSRPYLANVEARFIAPADTPDFVSLLERHVCQPVRWRESLDLAVETLRNQESCTPTLVEVGPGTVLHDMLGRGWRDEPRHHTATPQALRTTIDALSAQG